MTPLAGPPSMPMPTPLQELELKEAASITFGIIHELLFYGLVFCLFWETILGMLRMRSSTITCKMLVFATTLTFLVASLSFANGLHRMYEGLVSGNHPNPSQYLLDYHRWENLGHEVLTAIAAWLGGSTLIYRLYTKWDRTLWVLVLPISSLFASSILNILSLHRHLPHNSAFREASHLIELSTFPVLLLHSASTTALIIFQRLRPASPRRSKPPQLPPPSLPVPTLPTTSSPIPQQLQRTSFTTSATLAIPGINTFGTLAGDRISHGRRWSGPGRGGVRSRNISMSKQQAAQRLLVRKTILKFSAIILESAFLYTALLLVLVVVQLKGSRWVKVFEHALIPSVALTVNVLAIRAHLELPGAIRRRRIILADMPDWASGQLETQRDDEDQFNYDTPIVAGPSSRSRYLHPQSQLSQHSEHQQQQQLHRTSSVRPSITDEPDLDKRLSIKMASEGEVEDEDDGGGYYAGRRHASARVSTHELALFEHIKLERLDSVAPSIASG